MASVASGAGRHDVHDRTPQRQGRLAVPRGDARHHGRGHRTAGGRALTYRVLAEHAASGARSNAVFVEVVFTPPVTDLAAGQVRDGGVVGRWRMHPDTWSADVRRTPGRSSADRVGGTTIPAQAGSFIDPQPSPGHYVYSVAALYRDPDTDQTYRGRPAEVEVEVFDEPPRPWVNLGESREHESARVTLRWSALPDDVFLLMRRSAVEPANAAGDLLMLEEAEQVGLPLFNGQGITGTTANLALPAGRWVLIPFAVAGGRAVRGDCLHVDVVPSVTVPEAVRNGPDVQVSWAWPDGLRLARVVWRADGVDVPREIARSEFQGRGSVTFRRPEAASIRITGVVRSGVDELTSAAVTVTAATAAADPDLPGETCSWPPGPPAVVPSAAGGPRHRSAVRRPARCDLRARAEPRAGTRRRTRFSGRPRSRTWALAGRHGDTPQSQRDCQALLSVLPGHGRFRGGQSRPVRQ